MPARMLVTLSSAKPTNAKKAPPQDHRSGASHAADRSTARRPSLTARATSQSWYCRHWLSLRDVAGDGE